MIHRVSTLIFAVLLGLFAGKMLDLYSQPSRLDPDRYFHIRLSELMQKDPIPETLPQAEDLGWGKRFQEKEFLFHQLTALAYRLGGEKGVEILPVALSSLLISILFLIAARYCPLAHALLAVLSSAFLSPNFFYRLTLLRPHLLAMLIFLFVLYAVLRRSRILLFISCALFSLSYHAAYIPILLAFCSSLAGIRHGPSNFRNLFYSVLGAAAGVVLNPYFPDNIVMAVQHAKIAIVSSGLPSESFGTELIPFRSDRLVEEYSFVLLVSVIACASLGRGRNDTTDQSPEGHARAANVETIALALLLYVALCFKSPRAIEYAALTAPIFLAAAYRAVRRPDIKLLACSCLSVLLSFGSLRSFYDPRQASLTGNRPLASMKELFDAAGAGVREGAKIFNCEWDASPYIFYLRPDLRFVDILDPSFLNMAAPGKFKLRKAVIEGGVPDLYGVLRNVFMADFVLCSRAEAVKALEQDPNTDVLFPRTPGDMKRGGFSLFGLRESRIGNYPDSFKITFLKPVETGIPPLSGAGETAFQETVQTEAGSRGPEVFPLDLFSIHRRRTPPSQMPAAERPVYLCASVETTFGESEIEGKEFIFMGGGPHIRVWLNEAPLFDMTEVAPAPRMYANLVPLPAPARPGDRFRAVVCASSDSNYMALNMSFLDRDQATLYCNRFAAGPLPVIAPVAWPHTDGSALPCTPAALGVKGECGK